MYLKFLNSSFNKKNLPINKHNNIVYQMKMIGLLILIFVSIDAMPSTQMGHIRQTIESTLTITRLSDLVFPDSYPGAPAITVDPTFNENSMNASFLVSGESNKRVKVMLPSGIIQLRNINNNDSINVRNLRYNTTNRSVLNNNGEMKIYVGATRDRISTRIKPGEYTGTFLITVIY